MAKKKVLIIDDNPDILTIVESVLTDEGYMVAKAISGEMGLTLAHSLNPNLILLDLNMPKMDGWEVLKLLKADEKTSNIPVAIFSVRTDIKDKIFGLQRGAIDYITKPFQTQQLTDRVNNIFAHVQ